MFNQLICIGIHPHFIAECKREGGGTSPQVEEAGLCIPLFAGKHNSPTEKEKECQRILSGETIVANLCEKTCDYCPDLGDTSDADGNSDDANAQTYNLDTGASAATNQINNEITLSDTITSDNGSGDVETNPSTEAENFDRIIEDSIENEQNTAENGDGIVEGDIVSEHTEASGGGDDNYEDRAKNEFEETTSDNENAPNVMSSADISSSNNVHVPSDDGTIDDSNAKSQNSGVEVVNGDNHGDVVSNADDGINTGDGDDRTGDSKVGDEPANEDIQGSSDEADDETYADGKNNQPANEDTVEEDNTEKADIEIQDVDTEEKALGR